MGVVRPASFVGNQVRLCLINSLIIGLYEHASEFDGTQPVVKMQMAHVDLLAEIGAEFLA